MTYQEKLKDPRWQKKRLEILERDEWLCQNCMDDERTLHVHHTRYSAGDPWDCPDDYLITLCESCHMVEESDKNFDFYSLVSDTGITRKHLKCLLGIIKFKIINNRSDFKSPHWTVNDMINSGILTEQEKSEYLTCLKDNRQKWVGNG